ncbi:MAG: YkvA family protein [Anaerolineae bacterium]|jgi:uncharacterized membrane protein YkvA (DUF1232 family)
MSKRDLSTRSSEQQTPVSAEDTSTIVTWLREFFRQARLAWELFWDPRVPWPPKLIPPVTILYLLSPIDVIPDLTLGLGQLDDIAVLLLGFKLFIELCPPGLVREHLKALGGKTEEWTSDEDVIEGEYEVQSDEGDGRDVSGADS